MFILGKGFGDQGVSSEVGLYDIPLELSVIGLRGGSSWSLGLRIVGDWGRWSESRRVMLCGRMLSLDEGVDRDRRGDSGRSEVVSRRIPMYDDRDFLSSTRVNGVGGSVGGSGSVGRQDCLLQRS